MKKIKILISIIIISLAGQTVHAKNDHFYFKGDISSTNIFTFFIGTGLTALINYKTNEFTYDNYWMFPSISGSMDGVYKENIIKDMFDNIGTGVKLGYQSTDFSFFNWAAYGSLHYRYNTYNTMIKRLYPSPSMSSVDDVHRVQLGIGGHVILGSPENFVRGKIDFGLRYNVPFSYKGNWGDGPGCLNKGISPVFLFMIGGGEKWMKKIKVNMNIGFMVELAPYNMFKTSEVITKDDTYKVNYIGVNFTLCPWSDKLR
jgi:hypothetical protein